jgi:hypothetical protein
VVENLLSRLNSFSSFVIWRLGIFPLLSIFLPSTFAYQQPLNIDHLILTEVFYDTPGKDIEQEWVELANLGDEPIFLADFKLGDEESLWGGEGMVRFPEDSMIGPGQVIIVAQTAVGFRGLFGRDPDYEIQDSIAQVPDMERYVLWSNGDFALANDGDEVLLLDQENLLVDGINYGDSLTFFTPSISNVFSGQSIERVPANCDTNTAADWQPQRFPTPGKVHFEGECASLFEPASSGVNLLSIGQIQGAGDISPFINQIVDFRGVVSGFFEDRNAAGIVFYTLFVQDLPGDEDGDSTTSDGIAVFLERRPPDYNIGDVLRVSGKVTEFFGFTEIDDDGLIITHEASKGLMPDPIVPNPPAAERDKVDYFETLEGMMVSLPFAARVVGPTHIGCGFSVSESAVFENLPPLREAEVYPGPVLSILHHSDVDCNDIPQLKTGDLVSGITGPMIYNFDHYKIVQQDMSVLDIKPAVWPEIPTVQKLEEQQISIATFNLENHFDEIRDTTNSAEPLIDEFHQNIKRQKLAYVISNVLACPAVLAVQEVENGKLLQDLNDQLLVYCGFNYQISHRDGPDSRGLDVALLTDPTQVQILSVETHQTCTPIITGITDNGMSCPDGKSALFGRPPLQVDVQIGGEPFQFIVTHFKSKRGEFEETELRRIEQAAFVSDLVRDTLDEKPEAKIVVLGDMNDYELSSTMQELTKGDSLFNALQLVPLDERYSYIFDGRTQLIDGILVSEAIEVQINYATIFHINADYPVGLADDISADRLPYQGSDHDIPYIVLNLPDSKSTISDEALKQTAAPQIFQPPSPDFTPSPQVISQTSPGSIPEDNPKNEQFESARSIILFVAGISLLVIVAFFLIFKKR